MVVLIYLFSAFCLSYGLITGWVKKLFAYSVELQTLIAEKTLHAFKNNFYKQHFSML